MERQQALEDLFFAVRNHLLNCGRNVSTAEFVASKFVNDSEKLGQSIEDIKSMRNVFIA